MKLMSLVIVLPIILGLDFLSCNQSGSMVEVNGNMQQISEKNPLTNVSEASEILQKVENRYYAFTFYKAAAQNTYSRKGFGDETSVKREIEIEYSTPSQIKAEMRDGTDTKILISKDNITSLSVDGKKKKDYDDVYWGLTSTEFGDGAFFEVGKILVAKEYGQGEISAIRHLQNPVILGEDVIDGSLCYKIQGTLSIDELAKITYWIDKESFLIRQYERVFLAKKIPGGYFKTIETYTDIEAR